MLVTETKSSRVESFNKRKLRTKNMSGHVGIQTHQNFNGSSGTVFKKKSLINAKNCFITMDKLNKLSSPTKKFSGNSMKK